MTNNKLKCLIIDDEPAAQAVLKHFISMIDFLEIKKLCINTQQAQIALEEHRDINLLFLDINMPKETGLDFYNSLKNPPAVIFTTAYPQYAVNAFDLTAVDYLLKPISFERFLNAVNKAYQQLIHFENEVSNSILIKSNKVLHQINLSDIQVIEAFGDYIKIHTEAKTVVTNSTLTNFLKELTTSNFIRCHKSFAVNKNLVDVVEGNTIHIKTQQIPIGQKYKATFLKRFKQEKY